MAVLTDPVLPHLRLAVRGLLRRPGFALTCIATLALGIGASATVFSVVNALLLRPLPYATPDRLVAIGPTSMFANREIAEFRRRVTSLDQIASFSPGWLMALTGAGEPRQLNGARVSGNLFAMLGVAPLLGRPFGMEAETPGRDAVAVLGYELWQAAFSGDSAIVGRSIQLDGDAITVVGIMPPGFQVLGGTSDLWLPLAMDPKAMSWTGATSLAYGRLQPGTGPEAAAVELHGVFQRVRQELGLRPNWGTDSPSILGLQESAVSGLRPMLLVLLAAVLFLLLIACVNVANLFLVRTAERHQELAIRVALGAGRLDLARVLLAESLLLGGTGGALGIMASFGGVTLVRNLLPSSLPRAAEIAVDLPVVIVATAASLCCALVFGATPLIQSRRFELFEGLRQSRGDTRRAERVGAMLVAAQVALAVVLTTGAALMTRTMAALVRVDPGLQPAHLLTMRLQPTGLADAAAARVYWQDLLERVRAVPGVVAAGTILHLPTSGRSWHADVVIEGRSQDPAFPLPRTAWQSISPGYLETAGVPLIRGRLFEPSDRFDAPRVVLVNTAFAARMFPGQDPVGIRIRAGNATLNEWATIVGVVGSVRHDSLNVAPAAEIYLPFEQKVVWANSLVVRTTGDPLELAGLIRAAIWSINRDVPISEVRTMGSLFSASLQRPRMVLVLLGSFSALGMLLGALGIYGVVSYSVAQRRQEIGIRIALGALPDRVVREVAGLGLRQAMVGLMAGLPLALLLSRFLRGQVYGVTPTDPLSLLSVALLLIGVSLGASLLPARRAAGVDPAIVLKSG
jgi:predicted permease